MYVNSLLATLNARGSLLGGRTRRPVVSKIAFRTPTLSTDPTSSYDPASRAEAGNNIEVRPIPLYAMWMLRVEG